MTMYRILSAENGLQPFRSTAFNSRYLEQDLEDWVEAHPEVLTDGEPLLIIGRQVTTALGGTLDLLGLDAEGTVVVAELKRAPTPRDIIAQALEYATWVASLDGGDLRQLAAEYWASKGAQLSLEAAWHEAFGQGLGGEETGPLDLPAEVRLNEQQRILVVIEGANERVAAVARYLRARGVDIGLVEYRYYQTEGGEQILDVEQRIGKEQLDAPPQPREHHTEERVMAGWTEAGREAYLAFRDGLMQDDQLIATPKKTAISFYKQTRDGRVFICYFDATAQQAHVNFRIDSLEGHLDIEAAIEGIKQEAPPYVQVNAHPLWCDLRFAASSKAGQETAELMSKHVASKVG